MQDQLADCQKVSSAKFQGLLKHGAVTHCIQLTTTSLPTNQFKDELEYTILSIDDQSPKDMPPAVKNLIQEYDHLFKELTTLPPKRMDDHTIPLVPGAQPVQVRPCRYSPAQKDEIESQLQTMLQNGVIRPSASPYASPVLLVKKKDGSWHFCID